MPDDRWTAKNFARKFYFFSDLSAQVCSNRTIPKWIVSLGYRAPKNEGSDPGLVEAHNSASPFLSFVPFVHSFVHRENSRAWIGPQGCRASWEDAWMFALCAIGTRDPLNVPFSRFKIRDRYNPTNALQFYPRLFFEKKNIYMYFLRFYRQD